MQPSWLFAEDTPTYVYTILGGVLGILVVTAHNLVVGADSYYNLSGVFVGSGVAGFLAARGSGRFNRAGVGAGLLGTVPAFAWSSRGIRTWFVASASEGGPVVAAVLLCFFVVSVGMIGTLIGVFGGAVGGWIARKVRPDPG